jgi:DNA-directed RNA polymerase subunit RPC12/RpoP
MKKLEETDLPTVLCSECGKPMKARKWRETTLNQTILEIRCDGCANLLMMDVISRDTTGEKSLHEEVLDRLTKRGVII